SSMRVSGNSRRNWQPPHACWQGPNHHAPKRGETGWTTTRSLGEVGAMSVHSKPASVCSDCTFLKRDATRRQHFFLLGRRAAISDDISNPSRRQRLMCGAFAIGRVELRTERFQSAYRFPLALSHDPFRV